MFLLCELTGELKLYETIEGLYDEELEGFEDWEDAESYTKCCDMKKAAWERYDCKTHLQRTIFEYGIMACREYVS